MTREQARQELEGTWRFQQIGSKIALRDVDLINQLSANRPVPYPAPTPRVGVEPHQQAQLKL